ncbi:collagen-binding domain-containing protein [Companilactobacillus huachuanensis]|uniref:Collagen-binding domain-containing protein n=1 Tax=Companilactobacillus huachuanensis TaxID=2559914 RepID=A0ABW1RLH9_9LACO|nr:LPXTG cell wall anchor domain-containing protein [Companilactobacillus huachuanensis]
MLMKKGKEWALSCVAVSAVALMGMGTTVYADSTNNDNTNSENTADTSSTKTGAVNNALGSVATTQVANSNTAVTQATNDAVPDGGHVSDDFSNESQNQLGYASNFHVFANEAHLNAHTNGNVAVGDFYGNVNFGTNIKDGALEKEVSYIQTPHNIASSSFVNSNETRANKVVFGEDNDIDVTNPNRPSINGTNLDHITASGDDDAINADEIYQDKNGNEYIDIKNYLNDFLSNKSTSLTNKTPQLTVTDSDFPDKNQRVINLQDYAVTDDNNIVIDLDPSVLNTDTPIYIYGLSADKGGTNIIINVDTKGANPYNVNSQIRLIYNDGTANNNVERPNQETEFFDDNHLLWNFYDSTASDKLYTGQVNINRPFQGSVLAPKATVEVGQNLDGNIVADKVIINAETHRWDLQDNSDKETEYDKPVTIPGEIPDGWNNFEKPNIDNPDIPEEEKDIDPDTGGLVDPEEPSTEKPSTEKPDTEKPDTEKPGTGEEDNNTEDNNGNEEDNNTDENTDGEGNLITNGGSEGSDTNKDLSNGLLPGVVGNNKDESQTPSTSNTNESGTLPQTSETTGILATIAGLILLAFGLILKATHIKKEN